MRLELREINRSEALVSFETALSSSSRDIAIAYATRTGAVLRVDGETVGAFDREHHVVRVPSAEYARTLRLDVERESLPTNRLPARDGWRWKLLLRRARVEPQTYVEVSDAEMRPALPLWGHAHLDVAWLWDYSQARRKAVRTFANALTLMERDADFTFVQSQPQLYAFVEAEDPALFERVRARVAEGRFDASVAALWVESDCNVPSGESLLRQMLAAHAYCVSRFSREPSIAWLPDTFGFPRTLPTLLAHAGIKRFGTTKLQWNETTRFPHERFRWRGPDGSEVMSVMMASYDGPLSSKRVAAAQLRDEPLIVGYGDGGGGPTLADVHAAPDVGYWSTPDVYYAQLEADCDVLPVFEDELYLEYHRGTYTTHHDVKAANAAMERALVAVEEQVAWCVAVRAPREGIERLHAQLHDVWQVVLCNQFHDVLPGTSVRSAYVEVMADYERASEVLAQADAASAAMLPRATTTFMQPRTIAPVVSEDEVVFDNGKIHARINARGTLLELRTAGGSSAISQANLLALYRDVPRKWDAWNLDAGYERKRDRVTPSEGAIVEDGFEIPFIVGKTSAATMRISARDGEPFLRIELAVNWNAEHRILRVENWLALRTDRVTFGAPHGTIERSSRCETPAERARFEVPGQRFASVSDGTTGVALLAHDTYGWSARSLPDGGIALGHSLLRSPRWPDPNSEDPEPRLTWAFMPHDGASIGEVERAWEAFAYEPRVKLFESADPAVAVVAVKPAEDRDGVIMRLRECNGSDREARVRSAGRARDVQCVDGLERPVDGDARLDGEEIVARIAGYGLRSFRVRF